MERRSINTAPAAQASTYANAARANSKVWATYERQARKLKKCHLDLANSDFFQGKDPLAKK